MAGGYFNDTITYEASSGRVYNLKTNGILIKEANFHAWTFNPEGTDLQYGRRVSRFSREPAEYSTTLLFHGPRYKRAQMITQLHEDFELDIRTKKMAKVTWGGWYIDCYVSASSTDPAACDWTENTIAIYCPNPFWRKQEKKSFLPQDEPPVSQTFLDYQFDYNYDYFLGAIGNERWVRTFPFAADFRMTIFGPVSDPRVAVNGYPYQIDDTLESTEYIVIDSMNNTVTKYLANGMNVSIFDKRNKTNSVFEKIPAGNLSLTWTGLFGFDLVIFDERSEPTNDVVTT